MKSMLKTVIQPLKPSFWEHRRNERQQHDVMLEFYRAFIKPGSLCFDVGANFGNRTAVFLQLGATVVAVEPQDACIRKLRRRFSGDAKFVLVPEALGAQSGEAELRIASETTISSMSESWIEKVRASGRFENYEWRQSETVPVTTLDEVITRFGIPAFIKIDVEGFEFEVLKGLHSPVRALSIEFVPEAIENTRNCLRVLSGLGPIECNYSLGESMQLVGKEWFSVSQLEEMLMTLPDKTVFGDVYIRFVDSG